MAQSLAAVCVYLAAVLQIDFSPTVDTQFTGTAFADAGGDFFVQGSLGLQGGTGGGAGMKLPKAALGTALFGTLAVMAEEVVVIITAVLDIWSIAAEPAPSG